MKLITLIIGLLVVGCATLTPEQKQKALRDIVVGEYGYVNKDNNDTWKYVFLENGVYEWYNNGKKGGEKKWTISNGEIHVKREKDILNIRACITVYRINPDKSITYTADIYSSGKREANRKEDEHTFKKIK